MTSSTRSSRPNGSGLLVVGETSFRKRRERFGILPADRLRHMHVIGKTGSGKSTLLTNMIAQDLEHDRGVVLLDPHGDLVEAVLALVPTRRTHQVLLFAPEDTEYPIAFNVFRIGRERHPKPELLASELVALFRAIWLDSWGPRLEHVLRGAILAVAGDEQGSLLLLYRFLTEPDLRERMASKIRDPVIRSFWTTEFPAYGKQLQAEALAPVLNKLGAFVGNATIRRIIGQVRSRIDLRALLDDRGILLAKLTTGAIGEDTSRLLGSLILSSVQLAAWARGRADPPAYVYVDEFQRFVNDSVPTMLSESRKFGLGLTLAHQYLGQLPERARGAILGNAGSTIAFRLGAEDAAALAPLLEPEYGIRELTETPAHHAVVKMLAQWRELSPFLAAMLPPREPPPEGRGRRQAIIASSRQRFADHREDVDSRIAATMPPIEPDLGG